MEKKKIIRQVEPLPSVDPLGIQELQKMDNRKRRVIFPDD
jgi:hypothetical protein